MTHQPRRKFIKASVAAAAGMGLLSAASGCSVQNTDLSQMFVHHVFFWLKEPGNKEAMEKCRRELDRLVTIETIRYKHVGVAAPTDREVIDNTYQFSLLVIFDDEKGHDVYQEHQKHKVFIEECSQLWERVVVYDSWNP